MIKVKDLIKEVNAYEVDGDTYSSLDLACENIAYNMFKTRNISIVGNLSRMSKLVTRLEREYLRGE